MRCVVGKRYQLTHGTGIYIGYEIFTDHGYKSEIVEKQIDARWNNRRVFKLDKGHTWPFDGNYCTWDRDIKKLGK